MNKNGKIEPINHPWGDRGFSVIDPIGNSVYIYSDREPTDEFKQYYKSQQLRQI